MSRRPPDLTNKAGTIRIWRLLRPSAEALEKNPDWRAGLMAWFIEADLGVFSPVITSWYGGLVHLRPIEGQSRPPALHFEGAEYEITWFAINPAIEDVDWVEFYDERSRTGASRADLRGHLLEPPDMVFQWGGTTDVQAFEIAESLLRAHIAGEGPDCPTHLGPFAERVWRAAWRSVLEETVEHYTSGHWPVPEGQA